MHVIFYEGKRYRGGHYFGKIPLHRKSELEKMRRGGTHKSEMTPAWTVDVYNYDPKPYAHFEYWECPECYWHPKARINRIHSSPVRRVVKRKRL